MTQKIIVTTSPWKDYSTGKWMLSACLNIQLDGGSSLAAYPDVLQWMDKVQQAVFNVQWNNEAPKEIKPKTEKWDKELYTKLFHSALKVQSFTPFDVSKLVLQSFPYLHVTNFIFDSYKEVGNLKSETMPTTKFYTTEWNKLSDVAQTRLKQTRPITNRRNDAHVNDFINRGHVGRSNARQMLNQKRVIPFSQQPNAQMDLGQFHNFYASSDKNLTRGPVAIPKPEFEYHDVLSIITSYPVIMRKLGLVIDFELGVPPPAAGGTVRILPANLNFVNDVHVSCPATAYQSTAAGFYAAAKTGSTIEKGMLKINTNEFSVVQIDTDGAAMKLASHADSINNFVALNLVDKSNFLPIIIMGAGDKQDENKEKQKADEDEKEDKEEGLPTLRSAGIGLVKNGLADSLLKKLDRNFELHKIFINPAVSLNNSVLLNKVSVTGATGGKIINPVNAKQIREVIALPVNIPVVTEVLYADDLVHGYRLDVSYESGSNAGKWYSLHKRKNSYAFVPAGTKTEQPITMSKEDEIDEGCIHLVLTQDENDEAPDDQKVSEVLARWEGWSLSVPKPGKGVNDQGKEVSSDEEERNKYKIDKDATFRLQVETKHASKTLPMLRFGRTYKLKVRTVDIAGNGLPHDVKPENESACIKGGIKYLRYEPLPVPVLHQADEVVSGDKNKMRDRDGESIEHMVIRSNVGTDTASYEKNNPTTIYDKVHPLTTITYLHEAIRHVAAPRTSQHMAELHGMFDKAFANPALVADTYEFIIRRDPENKDTEARKAKIIPLTQDRVEIEYLADPMAAGVVLRMQTNTHFETDWARGQYRKFSFYFDEELNDSTAGKAYDTEQWKNPKSFRIKLAEGNATPSWDRNNRLFTIFLPKSAEIKINYACFWRPDDIDQFAGLHPVVSRGSNRVSIEHARKGIHWMFSPWRTIRLVHAVQQPLEKPVMDKATTANFRDYEDTFTRISTAITVHGSSTDKVDVEASWTEWVDDLTEAAPKQIVGTTHVSTIHVNYADKKLEFRNVGGAMSITADMKPGLYHPFNDTKHRTVSYTPVATTRYREYFTGIIETAKNNKKEISLIQTGDAVVQNILSTVRPVIPIVEYLLPSFNWIKNEKGNEFSHLKTSNIRVYIKRPWYSSGDDERLAVILPPKGVDPSQNTSLKKYCTVWGKDPAFLAPDLNNSNYPQVDHFPFAADYDFVKLVEENIDVSVAAYKVLFDKEKQLHYADIPINIGFAYFPFVKLVLARYQRNSIKNDGNDCCLSNVVQVDWMQVVPARATSVTLERVRNIFTVTLKGIAPFIRNPDTFAAAANNARVKINISVESALFAKTEDAFISINDRQTRTGILSKDFDLTFRQVRSGAIDFSERIEIDSEWSSKPFRIIIREYELHEFDPIRAQEKAFTNPQAYHEYGERLVFMDVFEINGSV